MQQVISSRLHTPTYTTHRENSSTTILVVWRDERCATYSLHSCPTKTWPHTAATQQHLWLLPDTGQHLFTLFALSTDMQKMLVLPMNIVFHDRLVGAFSFHFSFGWSTFKPQKSSCTAYCVFGQNITQKMWKWEENQKPPTGNTTSGPQETCRRVEGVRGAGSEQKPVDCMADTTLELGPVHRDC